MAKSPTLQQTVDCIEKLVTRNGGKITRDELIKEVSHLVLLRSKFDAVAEMMEADKNDITQPQGARVFNLVSHDGFLHQLHQYEDVFPSVDTAMQITRDILRGVAEERDELLDQRRGLRVDISTLTSKVESYEKLIGVACLALGVDPNNPEKLLTALTTLTTALRLLKGLSKDLLPTELASIVVDEISQEPKEFLEPLTTHTNGVYRVTKAWYDWFWDVDNPDFSSKVNERKGRMTQAIHEKVSKAMLENPDGWPKGMELIVVFNDNGIDRPTVYFANPVNDQVAKAFGGQLEGVKPGLYQN